MRIYLDGMEMVREVERDLYEMGVRYQSATVQDQNVEDDPRYETLELTAYQYSLKDPRTADLAKMVKYLGGNLGWANQELIDRIQWSPNPGYAWITDFEKWSKFIRDGKFSYHYAERLAPQLDAVINELKIRPNTRQALMAMYDDRADRMNWGGRDRVPCSLTYHFMLRQGGLTVIYSQRSCDFLKFFATDVYITVGMAEHVAREIDSEVVQFVHVINSLHAFRGDMDRRGVF